MELTLSRMDSVKVGCAIRKAHAKLSIVPDVFSASKRSEVMAAIRSQNTKPEIQLRRALHAKGLRFRLHVSSLPGKPDIVLPRYRTAIQVRGCFWHCHTCADGHLPHSRLEYWGPKLSRNVQRDRSNDRLLSKLGWKVIVVWECQLRNPTMVERRANRILRLLVKRHNMLWDMTGCSSDTALGQRFRSSCI